MNNTLHKSFILREKFYHRVKHLTNIGNQRVPDLEEACFFIEQIPLRKKILKRVLTSVISGIMISTVVQVTE